LHLAGNLTLACADNVIHRRSDRRNAVRNVAFGRSRREATRELFGDEAGGEIASRQRG
jgi:hypothetical protein